MGWKGILSTVLQKKVRAAILLYALLMLSIFSLLVQFYIQAQWARVAGNQGRKKEATAYLMAHMAYEEWQEGKTEQASQPSSSKGAKTDLLKGEVEFGSGQVRYQEAQKEVVLIVQLDSGEGYQYVFSKPSKKKGNLV